MFRFTTEMTEWIRQNCKGVEWEDVATNFNCHFGLSKTARQLRSHAHDNEIHNGIYHGHSCHHAHWRPVGSKRLDKDGYVVIKVAEPCKWRRAQLVEWEKYHKPIDIKTEMLIFLDGNRQNYKIDNLYLIPRRLIGNINQMGMKLTKENIDAVIGLAELRSAKWSAEKQLYGGYNAAMCMRNRKRYSEKRLDPEFKKKRAEYGKEYNSRPEVQERQKQKRKTSKYKAAAKIRQKRYIKKHLQNKIY